MADTITSSSTINIVMKNELDKISTYKIDDPAEGLTFASVRSVFNEWITDTDTWISPDGSKWASIERAEYVTTQKRSLDPDRD